MDEPTPPPKQHPAAPLSPKDAKGSAARTAPPQNGSMKNLKLKAARAAKDYSQDELARLCGVCTQTISAIEKGNAKPTINLCITICKTLDRTLDELFWED